MASCVKPECIPGSRDLDPNSDIEGIGSLIAFGLSAYLTLIICIISYLLNQDSLSNEIDRRIIDFVAHRRFFQKIVKLLSDFLKIQGVEKWNKALQVAVLNLSDQQVVTGLAILISGYVQLGCRGLAVYHWQLVVDLAFFSSITHLTTLTCLRTYFQKRKFLRLTRLICMGVIATMLGCAIWSTGYLNGHVDAVDITFPAWCLYHREAMQKHYNQRGVTGAFESAYVFIVLLYLGLSYLTRILGLFPEVTKKLLAGSSLPAQCNALGILRQKVRDKAIGRRLYGSREDTALGNRDVEDTEPNQPRKSQIIWIWLYRAILSVILVGQAANDLYRSVIWEITWLSLALSWGTIRIYADRTYPILDLGPTNLSSVLAEVNTWAFSQVISIFLLALPFLFFCEVAYDLRNEDTPRVANDGHVNPPVLPPVSAIQTNAPIPFSSTSHHFTPGDTQEHKGRGLYQHIWFRRTVLLKYLLSATMGADIVHVFPYAREFDNYSFFWTSVLHYFVWSCLDLFITWVFVFAGLCMQDVEPGGPNLRWKPRWAAMSQRTYAIVLNVTVIICLGVSVAYDVFTYYKHPVFNI